MDIKKVKSYNKNDRELIKYVKASSERDKGIPLKKLSKQFNITIEQISNSIEKLSSIYSLEVEDDKVKLINTPIDRTLPLEYDGGLKHLNSHSFYFENIESTNTFMKKLATEGLAQHGDIITTEHQTQGRGQKNRNWEDKPFMSILASVFMKTNVDIESTLLLSSMMGLAVSDAINEHYDIETEIKWPNDIYIEGKKCAGILIEGSILQTMFEYIIAGMGINVNYEYNDLPPNVRSTATSLRIETGMIINRMKLFNALMKNIDKYLDMLIEGNTEEIANKVTKILHHRGGAVIYKGQKYLVDYVSPQGKLVLSKVPDGGKVELLSAGELEYAYGY